MSELLIPADAEAAYIAELDAALAAHPEFGFIRSGTKIPSVDTLPGAFVVVVSNGGRARDLVTDEPLVTVDAYSLDEGEAFRLGAFCVAVLERAARRGAIGGVTCHVLQAGTPANNPHPDVSTHFRYSAQTVAALRRSAA